MMRKYWSIGLMSGTSMDGIDAAEIKTDGLQIFEFGEFISLQYSDEFRAKLKKLVAQKSEATDEFVENVESELTHLHADAVNKLLKKSGKTNKDIDLIGFHGHTIDHQPHKKYTWQIGNGRMLADLTGINVVTNFRKNDVMLGGQGAPLIPMYHKAIVEFYFYPAAVINIGGVANITFINDDGLLAFDTGPGNAIIDDFVKANFDMNYDDRGKIASSGKVSDTLLNLLMTNIYFKRKPPKSLDRDNFHNLFNSYIRDKKFTHLSAEDIVATVTEFTVQSIVQSFTHLSEVPRTILVCGGGLKNKYIIKRLEKILDNKVHNISVIDRKLNPDAIEAQGFAYLAVRSKIGLPITFASTTGIKMSSATGGVFYQA